MRRSPAIRRCRNRSVVYTGRCSPYRPIATLARPSASFARKPGVERRGAGAIAHGLPVCTALIELHHQLRGTVQTVSQHRSKRLASLEPVHDRRRSRDRRATASGTGIAGGDLRVEMDPVLKQIARGLLAVTSR